MEISLSVVIITFNESEKIARCISSAQPIADEIVIVDSHSTDETVTICKQMGCRVITNAFAGHIQQKNFAITQASSPYILSLDADEALDETAQKSILAIKTNWQHDGYSFNRLNNYCGRWVKFSGWYPDKKLRLWDSRLGSWQGQNPHDRYELKNGSKKCHASGNILHYTIDSPEQHLEQIDYFTDISSKALFEKGKSASLTKLIVSPAIKFMRDYIWKLGFLDGWAGWMIAKNSAKAKYLKYSKLRQLHNGSRTI